MTKSFYMACLDVSGRRCVVVGGGSVGAEKAAGLLDCGACEPECPVEAILPEDAIPPEWEPFVKINYAFVQGIPAVEELVQEYADQHGITPAAAQDK